MPVNNANNTINVLTDPQQQKQAKGSNAAQVLTQPGKQGNRVAPPVGGGDVRVTLSARGRAASAVQENTAIGNGNSQAVQQAQGNQGIEAVRAIKAYANTGGTIQNSQQQTQKTINRIGGTA